MKLDACYARHRKDLTSLAWRMVTTQAPDVVQDVFLHLLQIGARDVSFYYVRRCVYNKCLDYLKLNRETEALGESHAFQGHSSDTLTLARIHFHRRLKRLKPGHQAVIRDSILGFNATELAPVYGLTPSAVRKRRLCAIEHLRA